MDLELEIFEPFRYKAMNILLPPKIIKQTKIYILDSKGKPINTTAFDDVYSFNMRLTHSDNELFEYRNTLITKEELKRKNLFSTKNNTTIYSETFYVRKGEKWFLFNIQIIGNY